MERGIQPIGANEDITLIALLRFQLQVYNRFRYKYIVTN